MSDRPPPRRPELDAICDGWGADPLRDLLARLDLLNEWTKANDPNFENAPENKIRTAMRKRRIQLEDEADGAEETG